jgi:hypothetical protein
MHQDPLVGLKIADGRAVEPARVASPATVLVCPDTRQHASQQGTYVRECTGFLIGFAVFAALDERDATQLKGAKPSRCLV